MVPDPGGDGRTGEAELLGDDGVGCRLPEMVDPEYQPILAHEAFPAEWGGRLYRNPGRRPEHAGSILLVLLEEKLPAGETHHPRRYAFVIEEIRRIDGDMQLRAGGDERDIVAFAEHVAASLHPGRVGLQGGDILTGEEEAHRAVSSVERDLPRGEGLVGVGGPDHPQIGHGP